MDNKSEKRGAGKSEDVVLFAIAIAVLLCIIIYWR
jgi:hypothetical protein